MLFVTKLAGIPMAYSVDMQIEGKDQKHDRASKVGMSPKAKAAKRGEGTPPPMEASA